jgi:hypothetical protein
MEKERPVLYLLFFEKYFFSSSLSLSKQVARKGNIKLGDNHLRCHPLALPLSPRRHRQTHSPASREEPKRQPGGKSENINKMHL